MEAAGREAKEPAILPGVGLALGGGVVYAIASVGVYRALQDAGIPIVAVSGTSGGAIVGAAIASGMSSEALADLASKTNWRDLVRFTPNAMGIFSGDPIARFIEKYAGCKTIEELKLPFTAVCTDIRTGEEVRLKRGPLGIAVQASCAIPGLFQPVRLGPWTLLDGGIVDNLPVTAVQEYRPAVTLGVDVLTKSGPYHWRLRSGAHVVLRSYHTMMRKIMELQEKTADFIVSPDVIGLSILSFRGYPELITRGEEAVRPILPALQVRLADHLPPVEH